MEVKTMKECRKINYEIGQKYLELGEHVRDIVSRYEDHERNGDTGWDFSRLKSLYINIGSRFDNIGTKLIECNAEAVLQKNSVILLQHLVNFNMMCYIDN